MIAKRSNPEYLQYKTSMKPQFYNAPFSMGDLKSALNHTGHTSPRPDTIHNQMLGHLSTSTLSFLLTMYNHIWSESSHFVKTGRSDCGPSMSHQLYL